MLKLSVVTINETVCFLFKVYSETDFVLGKLNLSELSCCFFQKENQLHSLISQPSKWCIYPAVVVFVYGELINIDKLASFSKMASFEFVSRLAKDIKVNFILKKKILFYLI